MRIPQRLWLLTQTDRLALILTVLFGFAGGLLTIAQAALLSRVVDDVFLGGQLLAAEAGFFRLLAVIVILRSFLVWANEVGANRLGGRIKSRLRQELFVTFLQLGPMYTRGEKAGELATTLFEGVEALGIYFSQYLPQVILAALIPMSILAFIFPRDLISGIILFLTAPLIPLFMYLIGKGAEVLTKRQWNTLSRLSAYFLDSLQGLTTLKIFGQSKERTRSISNTSERFREITLKVLRVTFLSALVLELVATISTAMVAVEVSLRLLYGRMDFQQAFFLLILAPEFYLPLRMLGTRFHAGMAGVTAAKRIFEVLDQRTDAMNTAQAVGQTNLAFASLQIADLCFTYPGETQAAIENVNLNVHRGAHVALVGLTGAGKSTLAGLILGFIKPSSGEIWVGGLPMSGFPAEAWRDLIAWVPQHPYLFHDSIAANLRLARPEANLAELEEAARAACLDEFVHSLPDGFDTVIGEEGARLSGGEAQRLAIARAFLKNAPILILDEPTSNLDPDTENSLVDSIRRLMDGRTVITIAHRMNTFVEADQICVLENGRVVEKGTHQVLLALNGTYSRLVCGEKNHLQIHEAIPEQVNGSKWEESRKPPTEVPGSLSYGSTHSSFRSILFRLLSFLRGSWVWVGLSVLLGALAIASNVGLMGTAAYLISAAALHPPFGVLQIAIVAVRFFGISRGIFRYTERLASHDVTFRLLGRMRTWFYQALEPLAPARLMQYRSGDLLARLIADVDTLESFYVRAVAPPIVMVIISTGLGFFLARYDWRLAWAYLAWMAALGFALPFISWISSRRLGQALIDQRAALETRLVDGIRGLEEILAFNYSRNYSHQLALEDSAFAGLQGSFNCLSGFSNALMTFGLNAGALTILALSIPLVTSGKIAGPMLAAILLASQAGFEAVLTLPSAALVLSSCSRAAKRIFEVVDAKPVVEDSGPMLNLLPGIPVLECSKLSFSYPGRKERALEEVDLLLRPGSRIAIVGPSGSGKTTLGQLLLRLWDYSQGEILLNGHGLHSYAQETVRGQFSVVPQKPVFFNDTILQNLIVGCPSAGESQVRQAARRAQIDEFITRLPAGYATEVGERGFRLSGGQAQRLALARAYLKDASIFLLDEPTANLDLLTENLVLQALFNTIKDRSLILFTHRLVGLETMDEIIVLDHGRIVERGPHSGLLARAGLYYHMWSLQQLPVKIK